MIYRFLVLSDEVADFKREIKINAEASFFELHQALLDATGFSPDEIYSFFICDDDWSRKVEVSLYDMDASFEEDLYLMMETSLEELLEDEHQKLLYLFDSESDRSFYMELSEIILRQRVEQPICSRAEGTPPEQKRVLPTIETKQVSQDVTEVFYGDSEFDKEELSDNTLEDLNDESLKESIDENF